MKLQGVASLHKIPDGPAGIHQTLKLMRTFTREGKRDLFIRRKAMELVGHHEQKAFGAEVNSLFQFVRDRIRYIKDVAGIETVAAPRVTLEMGQGDCDDKAVLLAALLESIGHKTRFVAVALHNPQVFQHVLVETKIGRQWVPLETTENVPVGWYPPGVTNRMEMYNA